MLVGVILVVTNLATWFFSSHEIFWGTDHLPAYVIDTKDALREEREYCNAIFEMLHEYWQYYDVEYDTEGNVIARHNFWIDCIEESDAYMKADSLNHGDWEDFFYDWR